MGFVETPLPLYMLTTFPPEKGVPNLQTFAKETGETHGQNVPTGDPSHPVTLSFVPFVHSR
jgi:hypothetical protein